MTFLEFIEQEFNDHLETPNEVSAAKVWTKETNGDMYFATCYIFTDGTGHISFAKGVKDET